MDMKSILAGLAASILLTSAVRADVFVYRGIYKIVDPDISVAAILPEILNIYLVADYDGATYGDLIFGHIEGSKRYALSTASASNFGQASIPKGHTESFFFNASATTTNPTNFSFDSLVFHGRDQKLLIRKMPSSTIVQRPNTLKASGASISRGGSNSTFSEKRMALTFQGTATIKANNASKSINDILNALAADLAAKGFTSL